jgi:hypothetical protein
MKILVLGHGGHGKGTFCKLLEEIYGYKSHSSSKAAWPFIWPSLLESSGGKWAMLPPDIKSEYAYLNRSEDRVLLKELILLLNTPDKTTLTRLVLEKGDVYDGMRSIEEFLPSRKYFDIIFWVDGSERKGPDPSLDIPYDEGMVSINNNGTELDLRAVTLKLRHMLT